MIQAVRREAEQIAAVEARLKQIEEDNATAAAQIATVQACGVNAVIRGNLAATTMKDMMRSENQQMQMSNAKRSDDVSALQKSIDSSRKDIKEAAGKTRHLL
jgi:hypothetical protein